MKECGGGLVRNQDDDISVFPCGGSHWLVLKNSLCPAQPGAACLGLGTASCFCYVALFQEGAGPSLDDSGLLTPYIDVSGNQSLGLMTLWLVAPCPYPAQVLALARVYFPWKRASLEIEPRLTTSASCCPLTGSCPDWRRALVLKLI